MKTNNQRQISSVFGKRRAGEGACHTQINHMEKPINCCRTSMNAFLCHEILGCASNPYRRRTPGMRSGIDGQLVSSRQLRWPERPVCVIDEREERGDLRRINVACTEVAHALICSDFLNVQCACSKDFACYFSL